MTDPNALRDTPTLEPSGQQELPDATQHKRRQKQLKPWWQNPITVTLLVAIIAAVPAVTTGVQGWIQARSQLELERTKHLHEMRQKYLDKVLSDGESQRVLEFLTVVDEDSALKKWAAIELTKTKDRIKTKKDLYEETIRVVAKLANQTSPISDNAEFKNFWSLYNEKLLPVETNEIVTLMVKIGRELKSLEAKAEKPSMELKNLSFELASKMKAELQ